ncbi:ABC transporter ATP-binding protein [Mycoplana dimorpha]|uniref:Amino acid/amide ABC transporter ATP-binding protein 2 (HAAT family) n=1 Tax=Mycoplana dimorpha TaxID=28320 RepID=A0A2T5BBI3_MYCDI|nr:ABC transporter ATP-binding protein [Mycoplana dimorpha]PTM96335.1 amino acid/amide ABC transporter ATP-binding protein 2 (HAAT family) [Mycoplana dimorpha]
MLELKNIHGGYGKITILNGVSFSIPKGSITTVIGPNGAGKSTVFKAIFGLLNIHSGQVLLDGKDVTRNTPRQMIGHGVTYVPQGRNVVPQLSVYHNLELGGITATDQAKVRQRIETVMDQFPMLRQFRDRKAIELSGGQQKQLEVARALLLDPKLILIDEPSIGLSPNLVQEVFRTLVRLRDKGVTILMVEQNARSALAISDYGLVLELGQTRMHDEAGKLLADPRVGQLFLGGHVGGDAAEAES